MNKYEKKRKGKWTFVTHWLLFDSGWECMGGFSDFTKNKRQAKAAEKRTSYWNDQVYIRTSSIPVAI